MIISIHDIRKRKDEINMFFDFFEEIEQKLKENNYNARYNTHYYNRFGNYVYVDVTLNSDLYVDDRIVTSITLTTINAHSQREVHASGIIDSNKEFSFLTAFGIEQGRYTIVRNANGDILLVKNNYCCPPKESVEVSMEIKDIFRSVFNIFYTPYLPTMEMDLDSEESRNKLASEIKKGKFKVINGSIK